MRPVALGRRNWIHIGSKEAGQYPARVTPAAVPGSVCAFECRHDLPVVFSPTPAAAARLMERLAFYFARECVEAANGLWRASTAPYPHRHYTPYGPGTAPPGGLGLANGRAGPARAGRRVAQGLCGFPRQKPGVRHENSAPTSIATSG